MNVNEVFTIIPGHDRYGRRSAAGEDPESDVESHLLPFRKGGEGGFR
jgi:hypothetical protein